MENNEKNPARPEGRPEGDRPRNHGHNHNRGRSRNRNGNNNNNKNDKAPVQQPRNAQPRGEQEATPRTPETRESRPTPTAESRRQPPATGRPQRNIRRSAAQADLTDMDNLLIDDNMKTTPTPVDPDDAPDAAEVERILERDVFARRDEIIPDVLPEGKLIIAGIRFRAGGKTYFFDPGKLKCKVGQYAIVETARGLEFGEVCIPNRMVDESMIVPPLRPVVRIATEADIAHNKENREKEEAAYPLGVQKIAEHKLDMKLVSIQYTFDNSKLLFYYTSAGRVDFRELVKDLAGVFHVRIEMRQIGIRDESRMIGGLGACGRPLCCSTFLSDFGQVSMKMAKEQNLSLNSTKISGCCGRLMCCLRFEYDTYVEEIRKTPAPGTFVNTPDGPGVVTEIYPLQGEVKVSLRNQSDSAPKKYKREQVEIQARAPRSEGNVSEPDSDE
jgi:cell fate regulator YaaT (PSP1 superfamily)